MRDVGEPFDVAAYAGELPKLEQAESARLIRQALTELDQHRKDIGPIDANRLSDRNLDWRIIWEVLEKGWEKAPVVDEFDGNEAGHERADVQEQSWPAQLVAQGLGEGALAGPGNS